MWVSIGRNKGKEMEEEERKGKIYRKETGKVPLNKRMDCPVPISYRPILSL